MAKNQLKLSDVHELEGAWSIDGHPGKKFIGTMEYRPGDEIRLTVLDMYPGIQGPGEVPGFPNVIGETQTGDSVTMIQPWSGMKSLNIPGMAKSESIGRLAIVGSQYGTDEEPTYHFAKFAFSNLDEWNRETGITISHKSIEEVDVNFQVQESKEIEIPAINCKLKFGMDGNLSPNRYSVSIDNHAILELVPKEPQTLDWYLETIRRLRQLLVLLMDHEISTVFVRGATNVEEVENGKRKVDYDDILWIPDSRNVDQKTTLFMPFTRPDLEETLEIAFQKWFEHYPRIQSLVDLYTSVRYNRSMFVEFQTLALTQGLEGYHRQIGNSGYVDTKRWTKLAPALTGAIPEELSDDHKDSLRSRIKFGYEYSLRNRLKLLLNSLSNDEIEYVCKSRSNFIHQVVEVRNQTTHSLDNDEDFDWHQVSLLNKRLERMCQILLYHEMGLSSNDVVAGLKRGRSHSKPNSDPNVWKNEGEEE